MQYPDIYRSHDYVVLDFEIDTSHGDYGHPVFADNAMLLACWTRVVDGEEYHRTHWGSEFGMRELVQDCIDADFIVAHQAKYELGWLRRCGLDVSKVVVFDTKIAEYVLLGNLAAGDKKTGIPPTSTSLDACCKRRGWEGKDPVVDLMMKGGINPTEIPRPWLEDRCVKDVADTHRLFQEQLVALQKSNRLPVMYTRCILTPALADMEFEGMCLDPERVTEQYASYSGRLNELQREFEAIAEGINWKSPMQVAEFLYAPEPEGLGFSELRNRDGSPKRTKSKRKKADKTTIAALKPTTDRQKKFLALRAEIGKVQAALSKSLEFFKGICDEYDGIFYAGFNQTTTATHRLSSSGHRYWITEFEKDKTVQFQNMAREFKPMFKSREDGWLMVEVDGSQLEFRVAAEMGKDKQAMQDIVDPNFDIHCLSASVMNDVPYEEFLDAYRAGSKSHKAMRTAAKVDTFKPLYGGESGTKKQKRWYKTFKKRYAGIADTQEGWVERVVFDKMLTTSWGMQYFWPRAKRGHDGYCNVKSSVYNYPVQALATAEIIPIAIVQLKKRLERHDGIRFVNTVHDSVILEVREDMLDEVRKHAVQAFGSDVYCYLEEIYGLSFDVPLGCGITIGTHWSEGDEESYNLWPDGKREQVL
jgi:DNA polymerase I-like protein with 3'-5' exonuclease and polymerase domains